MKCALELVATAAVRANEIAEEKRIAAEQEMRQRRAYTEKLCEEIGAEMERMASKGKQPAFTFFCDEEDGGKQLKETRSDYADKRLSYFASGEKFSLKMMAQYFDKYCFQVSYCPKWVWRYGFGEVKAYQIKILPNPDCCK